MVEPENAIESTALSICNDAVHLCVKCTFDRKFVCRRVAQITAMTLDPDKCCRDAGRIALLDLAENFLDEILVLDWLLRRIDPAIADPCLIPQRHALDGVVAVAVNLDGAVQRADIQSALDGCEFSSLIGLAGAG